MILIIDDNEFRRNKICKNLYMDSIPVIGCTRDMENGYNKPIITIIVDPKPSEYRKVISNVDSTYYFCAKKPIPNWPANKIIIDRDGFISPKQIRELLYNDFNITLNEDSIGPITLNAETNSLYVGEAYMHLNDKQFLLMSFLIYNYGRRFHIGEIYDFLHFNRKISFKTFKIYVSIINSKSKSVNRGKIVEEYEEYYSLAEHIVRAIRQVKALQNKKN